MFAKLATLLAIILAQFNLFPSFGERLAEIAGIPFDQLTSQQTSLIPAPQLEGELVLYPLPSRDLSVADFESGARSALVLDVDTDKVLYSKNQDERLPIASLTKLMTALVVLDRANLEDIAIISHQAVDSEGVAGNLVPAEKITIRNLLYILLIESSNDAAVALAENISGSPEQFVQLMNEKAESFGLKNTHFANPSGLDLSDGENGNYSTAFELAQLTDAALDKSLIWQILRIEEIDVSSLDGKINHHLKNTNQLLEKMPNIIGGKTGYTEQAGEVLILAANHPANDCQIISVVLNANDRFKETEKLVNWTFQAYNW